MRRHLAYVMAVAAALSATMGWAVLRDANTGADLTLAARAFLDTLSADQKATVVLPADSPLRLDWHFIPKDQRKGLQIKHMDAAQRKAALALLRSALSQTGYDKATKIMSLEGILRELQKGQSSGPIRDPERYYYTIFGEPGETGRWALSIEGHHLSLNFAVDQGNVIASTPTFFAANPTVVREGMPGGVPVGTRVLADEELLAFQLLESLSPEQRKTAILADKAPSDIRAAGKPQSPEYATEGVAFGGLNGTQQKWLRRVDRRLRPQSARGSRGGPPAGDRYGSLRPGLLCLGRSRSARHRPLLPHPRPDVSDRVRQHPARLRRQSGQPYPQRVARSHGRFRHPRQTRRSVTLISCGGVWRSASSLDA